MSSSASTILRIAIQKSGRLSEDSIKLFKECGIKFENGSGKLKSISSTFPAEFLFLDDWRLRRLDDAQALLAARPESGRRSSSCELLVSRDQRVLRILLDVPSAGEGDASVQLAVDGAASAKVRTLRQGWLGG